MNLKNIINNIIYKDINFSYYFLIKKINKKMIYNEKNNFQSQLKFSNICNLFIKILKKKKMIILSIF